MPDDEGAVGTEEAPAVEAGAEGTVETPATTEAPAVDYAAEVEKWGGADKVNEAIRFQAYLNTQEGAADFFVDAGLALGIDPDRLEALFKADEAATAEALAAAEEEDSRVLTAKEVRDLIKAEAVDPITQAQQAQQQAQQVAVVQSTVNAEAARLEIPANVLPIVLNFADAHLAPGEMYDPEKVKVAMGKGLEDWQAVVQQDHTAYLAKKAESSKGAPTPLKGGSPGGEVEAEPMNTKEAKERVRAQMRSAGVI